MKTKQKKQSKSAYCPPAPPPQIRKEELLPETRVQQQLYKDGVLTWVSGYVVCDDREIPTIKGMQSIDIPKKSGYVATWSCALINSPYGSYKPILVPKAYLRLDTLED